MKKNRGWGLKNELVWICVFVLCLITAIVYLYKMNLLGSINDALNPDYNSSYDDLRSSYYNVEGNNNYSNNKSEHENISDSVTFSYTSLENKMIDSSKTYILDYYNNNLGLDTIIISVSQLKEKGYLSELVDGDGNACSGYMEVYKIGEEIEYKPYLKCNNYETDGYIERRDS